MRRVLDHYLHTACTRRDADGAALRPAHPDARPSPGSSSASRRPPRRRWPGSPPSTPRCSPPSDWPPEPGYDTHAWQLAWTLSTFLLRRGSLGRPALAQRRRPGRRPPAAMTWPGEAHAAARPGPRLRPVRPLRRRRPAVPARAAAVRDDRRPGQPGPHPRQPDLAGRAGSSAPPTRSATPCAPSTCSGAAGHRPGQAMVLNDIGYCHALLGNYQQALAYCEQALAAIQRAGRAAAGRPPPGTASATSTTSSAITSRPIALLRAGHRPLPGPRRPVQRGRHARPARRRPAQRGRPGRRPPGLDARPAHLRRDRPSRRRPGPRQAPRR